MRKDEISEAKRSASGRETVALPRYRRVAAGPPPMLLTARDLAILDDVWHYRLLTTTQLETLRACDPKEENRFISRLTLTRRLKLLFHHRYLRRLPRPVTRGSREPVYVLDAEGARALALVHEGVRATPPSRLPGAAALDHLLEVVQVRLSLSAVPGPDYSLLDWLTGEKARFRVTLEDSGRKKQGVTIVPDGAAILRQTIRKVGAPNNSFVRHHAFIEVDRGTEPPRILTAKGRAYLAYWESGGFARDFNVPVGLGFRVLFVAPTPKRAQTILKALGSLEGPRQLFRVALAADITPERVMGAVWLDGACGRSVTPFAG